MKYLITTFLFGLLISSSTLFGQASWSYYVWFKLYDKNGTIITPDQFKKKRIRLLTSEGAQYHHRFKYDSAHEVFKFSQSTVTISSILAFISGSDTTIIDLSTKDLYISRVDLINGYFDLQYWFKEVRFQCNRRFDGQYHVCFIEDNLKSYQSDRPRKDKLPKLVEVRLE
jgi:hypothetical protein